MSKSRFLEEAINAILNEQSAGMSAADPVELLTGCRGAGAPRPSIRMRGIRDESNYVSQLGLSSCSAIRSDGSRASDPDRSATEGPAELRRFLVAALCMIPAAMLAIGFLPPSSQINLRSAYHALFFSGDDSWRAMLTARQFLAVNPGQDVYQAVFFGQGVKFQYPVTSLLFIEWLDADVHLRYGC